MRVKFWGTRGSVPTPGRATEKFGGNTACVEVLEGESRLILDAGTGVRELGLLMMEEEPRDTAMLFSHVHWDHIQGLPFFVPFFRAGATFTIFAPPAFKKPLEKVLYKQMAPDVFPVDFADLAAEIRFEEMAPEGTKVGPFLVSAFTVRHPGGAWAYRVACGDRTIIYATDNEVDPEADPEHYQKMLTVVGGANLLIADGQYTLDEYPEKRGWGHGVLEYVAQLCEEAEVKRLALTHHDPMRDDDALLALERKARNSTSAVQIFFARDGLAIEV